MTVDAKPKINLDSVGVIPVVVQTTTAGENGNPLAFDATRLHAASARFGNAMTVGVGGGTSELHGVGHGDPDVMLHFAVQETGLSSSDTDGRVIGDFALDSGLTATFFGCETRSRSSSDAGAVTRADGHRHALGARFVRPRRRVG